VKNISQYTQQTEKTTSISLDQHFKDWEEIFSGIQNAVDLVAFQDGHVAFEELSEFIQVNKQLADQNGLNSWINTESFDRDMPIKFLPIKWDKMRFKLDAAAQAGIQEALTFEFSHFMSPQSAYPQAGHLYQRYLEYKNFLSCMKYAELYQNELLQEVIPFWEHYSIDTKYGGFFSCIDDQNIVFDTDKFIWLQSRQIWMFATLYDELEPNKKWLTIAEAGAEFILQHGHDGAFNWYFSLNQQGAPLIAPYNIFSYTFACLSMAKLYKITNEERYKKACLTTLDHIHQREENPKGKWNKNVEGTRPLKNFALPYDFM
jgi:hypothetical protein